ncbi:hypothetical protein BYT27DRAFT_7264746 [Phlegmacium glaucopus]|nr:hypothetical protein BYT27DRAFT_7264746 [Phlegmacium glaucopus]
MAFRKSDLNNSQSQPLLDLRQGDPSASPPRAANWLKHESNSTASSIVHSPSATTIAIAGASRKSKRLVEREVNYWRTGDWSMAALKAIDSMEI